MEKLEIKVKGMMCEGCENRIKNALFTIDGVEKVEANHKTGLVKVEISKELEINTLKNKIDDIGFEVE